MGDALRLRHATTCALTWLLTGQDLTRDSKKAIKHLQALTRNSIQRDNGYSTLKPQNCYCTHAHKCQQKPPKLSLRHYRHLGKKESRIFCPKKPHSGTDAYRVEIQTAVLARLQATSTQVLIWRTVSTPMFGSTRRTTISAARGVCMPCP